MAVKTYNPKEVTMAFGAHLVSGYADDSFITIEPNGDGISKIVGCDGEVVRSISPDDTYNLKLTVLYNSPTNTFLNTMNSKDMKDGSGTFSITIKDLKGGLTFSTKTAWVVNKSAIEYGKEAPNREWEISTGSATITE